tara:strand:- start:170 stop:367 length:198 start_codon:yes stop_codon:yes gene_type:complete
MMVDINDIDPDFRAEQAGWLLACDSIEKNEKGLEILQSLTPAYKCKAIWRRDRCIEEAKLRKESL